MNTAIKVLQKKIFGIIVSVLIGFLIGTIILWATDYSPVEAYRSMFQGVFGKPKYISQVIINAIPIILTALSVSFASKAGLFNIGAEGQYVVGTVTAAILGYFVALPAGVHPVVIMLAAVLLAGLFGMLSGWLKIRFGIHEVISTIMLNWIAFYFNNYVLSIPGVKKEGAMASNPILSSARLSILGEWKKSEPGKAFIKGHDVLGDFLRTDLHWGILIAVLIAIGVWFFLRYTKRGYEIRSVGLNSHAARFSGIDYKKNALLSMFIAGALAGLAGAIQIMGTNGFKISVLSAQEGYGWNGISVALMAGNNPLGCIVSGIFYSALKYGGTSIQSDIGAPSEIINIMIGTIVFCIAMQSVYPMLADYLKRRKGGTSNAK